MCTIIYAEAVPEAGGDTVWMNECVAYETLSEPWKAFLLGLEAEQDVLHVYAGSGLLAAAGGEAKVAQLKRDHPPRVHPVVIAHPITGKPTLFVNTAYTRRIIGMRHLESDAILHMLFEHQKRLEFAVRFKFAPGSIAMWDNFATQHNAVADYYPQHRKMRRITAVGRAPAAARAARPRRAA